MEGSWRGILAALVVVAGLAASGSSQIIEGPKNATVLVGQEAHFNCTISRGWKLIMWSLNDTVVLIVTPTQLIIPDKRFFSKSYEEGGNFISELIIYDVQPSDAGHVKCSLENSDHQGSAFLSVQGSVDKPGTSLPTWAIVLLAVSFSLLFILTVVLIVIFCCHCVSRREKTESSFQSEIMKSENVKTNKETFEPDLKSGNENYGFSSGELITTQTQSLPPKSYEPSVPKQQSTRQPQQEPDHHQRGPTSRPHVSFHIDGPRITRNVTLV